MDGSWPLKENVPGVDELSDSTEEDPPSGDSSRTRSSNEMDEMSADDSSAFYISEGSNSTNEIQDDDYENEQATDRDSNAKDVAALFDIKKNPSIESLDILMCDVCYKRFSNVEEQSVHNVISSPPTKYTCEKCGIALPTECAFETHKSVEHSPNPFSSDEMN